MTRRPSADRLLRRAALAGYGVAGAAGALTVGLIAGIVHSSAQAASPTGPGTDARPAGASSGDDAGVGPGSADDGSSSDDGTTSRLPQQQLPQGGLGGAPQGAMPQGGSHGS